MSMARRYCSGTFVLLATLFSKSVDSFTVDRGGCHSQHRRHRLVLTESDSFFQSDANTSSRMNRYSGLALASNAKTDDTVPASAVVTTTPIGTGTTASKTNAAAVRRAQHPQRIAVVGTGAVGGYYGARLWEVGHEVHFHMRGEHYQTAQTQGLTVTSVEGDVRIDSDTLQAYETTVEMADIVHAKGDSFDWVVVALKSSSLDAIPELIDPLLTPLHTRVLVIMNGMVEGDLLHLMRRRHSVDPDEPLNCCRAVYGGMALICSNRVAPATIDHTYFGLLSAGVASSSNGCSTTIATNSNDVDDAATVNDSTDYNQAAFRALFADTIVNVAYEESLLQGRWKKMVWNLPFNGISVAMGGITVDQIVQDPGLRQLAYTVMDETILAANTDLEEHYGKGSFTPLGETERSAMMKLSDDMGPYKPSTMLDFVNRRSMEVKYLFRTPLDRAKALGLDVPRLETIVTQIEAYQRKYGLF